MKLPQFRIRTRSGQLGWLQVLSLAISAVFYAMGDIAPALLMLVLATLFGVTATMRRVRDAQRTNPELFQQRKRKR